MAKTKLIVIGILITFAFGFALYLNDIRNVQVDIEVKEIRCLDKFCTNIETYTRERCTDSLPNITAGSQRCALQSSQADKHNCVNSLQALKEYLKISEAQTFLQRHPDADIFIEGSTFYFGPVWEIKAKSGPLGVKGIVLAHSSIFYDHWYQVITCNGTIYFVIPTPYYGGS